MGIWTIVMVTAVSCQKSGKDLEPLRSATAGVLALTCADTMSVPKNASSIVTISTLTNDKIWKLNGITYVAAGQTLTIEPGTKIVTGKQEFYLDPNWGAQNIAGLLIIGRGGKLVADGKIPHSDSAIVFTTLKQLGVCESGCDVAGSGPSVVIFGAATTNRTGFTYVTGIPLHPGVAMSYGAGYSINNADNSGILRYVRIEFPGYLLLPNNKISGLTLAGVGSGTIISHVQVSYGRGDAFAFLGGTVNCDHLAALAPEDDGLDFDHGYTGSIGPAIVLEDPCTYHALSGPTTSDANGIEADNDAAGTTAMPRTRPVLRHLTVLGYATNSVNPGFPSQLLTGARFRRNAIADMEYAIIAGFPTGVRFDAPTGTGGVCNSVVHGYSAVWNPGPPVCTNTTGTTSIADNFLQLGDAASPFFECPNAASYSDEFLIPDLGSPADGTSADYKGAFDPNSLQRWTAGWAKFDQASCICCN